jgi:AraC-type transcriptional regulator
MAPLNHQFELNQRKMKALLLALTTGEGLRPTIINGVKLARTDHDVPRTHALYEPSIFFVVAGRKSGYVGEREFVCDASNYFVLSIPLPFEVTTNVERGEPFLGVSIRVEMNVLTELADQLKFDQAGGSESLSDTIRPTPVDLPMSDSVVRLLECLQSLPDAEILGPSIVREIVYRVLSGPQGYALRSMLNRDSKLPKIPYLPPDWKQVP